MTPASSFPSSQSNSNDYHGDNCEPKEGVDASGGPLLGEEADESIKIGTIHFEDGSVYEGELKDGKAHGRGVCKYADGNVYDGEWKDNKHHGWGARRSVYDGEFNEGNFHGRATFTWADGDVYEGQFSEGKKHGKATMKFASSPYEGDVYEGEHEDDKRQGKGVYRFASGDVYDGEWRDNLRHGAGKQRWNDGDSYEGGWMDGWLHGRGTYKWENGTVYEGEFQNGAKCGRGIKTWVNGGVYEGAFVDGERHGWGTMKWPSSGNLYEGEWKDDKQHGRGTVKWWNGDIYEGDWENGQKTRGTMTWADGEMWTGRFSHDGNATALDPPCEPPIERKLRSQRSQQQRLRNSTRAKKTCEYCGVDDYHYKLRVCSSCNLALYCSIACQKATKLPSKESDRLVLKFDRNRMADLNAGLRYGKKYMDNLKHLEINLKKLSKGDESVKLSSKQLSLLLRSKRGALNSVFWWSNGYIQAGGGHCRVMMEHGSIWKELHGLQQLRLEFMKFDDVQPILDIIDRQRSSLLVLWLPYLLIDWHKAKCRRAVAQAVNSCKHLVKLDLAGSVLMDPDLKVMLHDLPNMRVLNLGRNPNGTHEFTDKTCGLIARKCPGLQELNLYFHYQLSARGIRKIFEGCVNLRSFYTTTRKLSGEDIQRLLDIAPQLMFLSVADGIDISEVDLSKIVEATGGRTVLQVSNDGAVFEPDGVSAKTKEKYHSQTDLLRNVWKRQRDPEVANEWAGMLEG